jgi:hypothetical protein
MTKEELLKRIHAAMEQLAPAVKRHVGLNVLMNKLAKIEAEVKRDAESTR